MVFCKDCKHFNYNRFSHLDLKIPNIDDLDCNHPSLYQIREHPVKGKHRIRTQDSYGNPWWKVKNVNLDCSHFEQKSRLKTILMYIRNVFRIPNCW
jgi:hypothetical protein